MKKVVTGIIIVAVAAGLIYYFAFRNNGSSSQTDSMSDEQTQTTTGADTTPQATNSVKIENMAFTPVSITVKKGTTVTWTNNDTVSHTVTETDGENGPDSKSLAKGDSYTFTFNEVGSFKYKCSIHPSMTGRVTVTE